MGTEKTTGSGTIIRARKEREKQQRIESIIESAKRAFFSKGYMKATMNEIAKGAEITKPTIYQYFKNKDDLFFSLMTPVIDDIGVQLALVEKKMAAGEYKNGKTFLLDMFQAFYHSYELSPDTFRIVQMFQQTGLVSELDPDTSRAMDEKGRKNFELGRKILDEAMEKNLIKRVDLYSLTDLFWGLTVGVIQLEDIKGDDQKGDKLKKATLNLAREIFIAGLAPN